jgi:hypothetical protein
MPRVFARPPQGSASRAARGAPVRKGREVTSRRLEEAGASTGAEVDADADTFEAGGKPADLPAASSHNGEGTATRRFTLKAPSDVPLVLADDLTPEVEAAARHLHARYADVTSRELLNDVMTERAFDMVADEIPDEQRPGKLMSAIPLDEAPVDPPLPPLQAAVLCVETATRHKVDAPLALLERSLAAAGDVDVLLAPEWLFVPEGRLHTAAEADDIIAALCALSAGRDGLLVPGSIAWVDDDGGYHNTAVALCDGAVLKRLDKAHDGDDIDFARAHGATYARGEGDGVFTWRGRRVGLEICRDHADAKLRWDLEDDVVSDGRRTVDLQLVVSCGVAFRHTAVGMGGACLLANGETSSGAGMAQVGRRVPREDGMYKAHSPVAFIDEAKAHDVGQGATLKTFTV